MIRNFSILLFFCATFAHAATLTPIDVSRFAVDPDAESSIQWKASQPIPPDQLGFTIYDVYGNATDRKGTATLTEDTLTASVSLPQGYWEIAFDSLDERFGIVSLPASEKWDKYFAIDAALSWLVHNDELREGMVKLSKRAGIGMLRERLRLSSVSPEAGKFDWDTRDHYDLLRETCKKYGVEVLELFHDTPRWMGRIEVYPKNLIAFADAADRFTEKWEHTWGGIELWNEPDIFFGGNLPADQYLPIVKAYAYRAKQRDAKTPIVGGVLAIPNKEWIENAKANGLLDLIDIFSFHTYDRAVSMENIVETYRNFLCDGKGHENMPLWLTECGRPWKKGPGRPPVEQDLESVTDIVMKGIESKCCGVDRYFPFVLPYYEENDNNFGMLDKQGTPLRSFCGYAQMIQALAFTEYVGDLKIDKSLKIANADAMPPILRARVFRKSSGGPFVVVLYTGKMEPTKFESAFSVQKAECVTGETCDATEIHSGLIYLYANAIPSEMIQKETNAMRLLAFAKKTYKSPSEPRVFAPVVPVFQYDEKMMKPNSKGHQLDPDYKNEGLTFQFHNLSDQTQTGSIEGDANRIEIPPRESRTVKVDGPFEISESMSTVHYGYSFKAEGEEQRTGGRLAMNFLGNPTIEGQRQSHPDAVSIPIQKERWTPGIPAHGKLTITTAENGVKFSATFTDGDKWCYPKTKLPENVKLTAAGGVFARIRCTGDGTISRIFLFEKTTGAGYLSDDSSVCPADGKWHVILVPFSAFAHSGATPPDLNSKLDFDTVEDFSFGFNTRSESATLEVAEVWIY